MNYELKMREGKEIKNSESTSDRGSLSGTGRRNDITGSLTNHVGKSNLSIKDWLFFASNGQPFVTKEERTTKGVIYREDN